MSLHMVVKVSKSLDIGRKLNVYKTETERTLDILKTSRMFSERLMYIQFTFCVKKKDAFATFFEILTWKFVGSSFFPGQLLWEPGDEKF